MYHSRESPIPISCVLRPSTVHRVLNDSLDRNWPLSNFGVQFTIVFADWRKQNPKLTRPLSHGGCVLVSKRKKLNN